MHGAELLLPYSGIAELTLLYTSLGGLESKPEGSLLRPLEPGSLE